MRKWIPGRTKYTLGGTLGILAVFTWDRHTEAQLLTRNVRTFYHGIALAFDYKLHGDDVTKLPALHERVANQMFDVFEKNAGLYIKIGQVIAAQSAVLPTAYQQRAKKLLDSAPAVPLSSIERVFLEDYGKLPQHIFKTFDPVPVASASIAQVHRATLWSGELVAVKVQKPAVRKQMTWDLLALRMLLHFYEYMFELPLSFTANFIERHIRQEVDFVNEARNGQRAWNNFLQQPKLRQMVYVPKIYGDISTERVLICEWVDGVQLTDTKKIAHLGLDYKEAMSIAIEAFASQIFESGFVHGDPHAGNVLVRNHPQNKRKPQVILLDHGLYVQESKEFRLNYCRLWQALYMFDLKTVEEVSRQWGIHDIEMFASITLQKPFSQDKAIHLQRTSIQEIYDFQMGIKARLKHFLEDQARFPQEMIFILRNMEIVRANNMMVGSPVNRLNLMAKWAVRGIDREENHDQQNRQLRLYQRPTHWVQSLAHFAVTKWRRFVFEFTLFMMNLSFCFVRVKQSAHQLLYGAPSQGFEELIDQRMKEQMYQQFGIVIDEHMFDA
ncbi:ABC1-domain-containing protein [Hesseltinella vesiculosa]|uniref:ABC1-domain-containing protein n=1 Tax=Hesseltinella vesiculosa TaxID=101127 RepID=A0A1X2G7D7_9FUNG|nr:ABC1-domain-containing protein [Hesseltinella vesiculosa]